MIIFLTKMEQTYDLRTVAADKLKFLLTTAREELINYERCKKNVEILNSHVKAAEKYVEYTKSLSRPGFWCIMLPIVGTALFIVGVGKMIAAQVPFANLPLEIVAMIFFGSFFLVIGLIITLIVKVTPTKNKISEAIAKEQEVKNKLAFSQQKLQEAHDNFNALYYIPDDYSYEQALTEMIRYIDNFRAENWKQCVETYELELHRSALEENAAQQLAVAQQQMEYARQARNASRPAAAGAWASAAGIWRISSKL